MAWITEAFWQLAHYLHPDEPLEQSRGAGPDFARLQQEQILTIRLECVALDSTIIKVHPDGTGALKKAGRKPSGVRGAAAPPRFIWLPRMLNAA